MTGGNQTYAHNNHLGTWEAAEFTDFAQLSTVFFSPAFLVEPAQGWVVTSSDPDDRATGWMTAGTLVKMVNPSRVWRLTGHADFRTGYLEGCWPD